LPEELMEVLEWHADRLPDGPMKDSIDLAGIRQALVA
jgi:hypothetical protein